MGQRTRQRLVPLLALLPAAAALVLTTVFASHSLPVIWRYLVDHASGDPQATDFLNYYTAGRTLLVQPGSLYQPEAEAQLQRAVTGRPDLYSQFQNMPQVALLFLPLALLPYGHAYLLWFGVNLALLAAGAALLAPRLAGLPRATTWVIWVLVSLSFAPAQFALVDGQTTFVTLFGFALWVACCERGWQRLGPFGLLLWSWKPQLLPPSLVSLVLARRLGQAALVLGLEGLAFAAAIALSGPSAVQRYVDLARGAAQIDNSGQTIFGLAQELGAEPIATIGLSIVGAGAAWGALAALWWHGLRPDPRRFLQFAVVPMVAVLVAARAFAYELTLWLAVAWLVLRYLSEARRARPHLLALLGLTALSATLSILSGGLGIPWGAISGLALLAAIVRESQAWRPPGATAALPAAACASRRA